MQAWFQGVDGVQAKVTQCWQKDGKAVEETGGR